MGACGGKGSVRWLPNRLSAILDGITSCPDASTLRTHAQVIAGKIGKWQQVLWCEWQVSALHRLISLTRNRRIAVEVAFPVMHLG